MKNNFSSRVQLVVKLSQEEAIRLGHDYIGTEHLLLGLIREGEGVAVKVLKNLGVELEKLKRTIEDMVKPVAENTVIGNPPLTKRAEKILKSTYLEAKNYKSDVIGTEHFTVILGQRKRLFGGSSIKHVQCRIRNHQKGVDKYHERNIHSKHHQQKKRTSKK